MLIGHVVLWIAGAWVPDPAAALAKDWNTDRTFPVATFSPDDRYLAYTCGASGQTVALWDLVRGTHVRKFYDRDDRIESLAFSPDGRLLAGSDDVDSWLWDVTSGKCVRQLQGRGCFFSPDGKAVVTGDNCPGRVPGPPHDRWFYLHVWETATGKNLRSIRMPNAVCRIAFSGDGRHVAVDVIPDTIRIWDIRQGREVRALPAPKSFISSIAFSPGGEELAYTCGREVRLWDQKAGKTRRRWTDAEAVYPVVYSPDGRWLAWGGHVGSVRLARAGSDQPPWAAGRNGVYVQALTFSRDGTLLAAGTEGAVHLVEVASGQEVLVLAGHAPLFWPSTEARPTPEMLERQWRNLASTSARDACHAAWALAAAAPQSVPFLRKKLRPAEPVDRVRLSRALKDLAGDSFRARVRAEQELERIGTCAEPALRRALGKEPSLEFARRAGAVLRKLNGPVRNPELLRSLRALKVLEHVRSEDARRLIEAVARGEPDAPLTQAARASLGRLARAGAPRPHR